jgi:hypothetical protein
MFEVIYLRDYKDQSFPAKFKFVESDCFWEAKIISSEEVKDLSRFSIVKIVSRRKGALGKFSLFVHAGIYLGNDQFCHSYFFENPERKNRGRIGEISKDKFYKIHWKVRKG